MIAAVRLRCTPKWIYPGIANWLSLWLAIGYLWVAIFHPETCAPYNAHRYYVVTESQPTETLSVESNPIQSHLATDGFNLRLDAIAEYGNYISSEASSNAAWLLRSHNHADAGFTLISFMILDMPRFTWLHWLPAFLSLILLQTSLRHQFSITPPVGPPRFLLSISGPQSPMRYTVQ